MNDHELVQAYAKDQCQEAFRDLVNRHLPMVYTTARRMTGDAHLAEEVAQSVFVTLAQKANTLGPATIIGGWLHLTTRHLSLHAVRNELRRHQREQEAADMQSLQTAETSSKILDQLEPALAELEQTESDALVLRYLENRSLRDVGREIGVSEDAARMRVNRALDRLRGVFARRGVAISSVGLAGTLVATTTSGALPTGLAAAITAAAFTATSSLVITATPTTLTSMFNLKVVATVVSATILTGTGTYLFQQRQLTRLQKENRRLIVEQAGLMADHEAIMKSAQENRDQVQQSQKDLAELLRLRNQVGQMRREQEAHKRQEEQRGAQVLTPTAPSEAAYISKDQLAFVGYGTPEAALQSLTWAMTKGTYDQALAGLSPQVQEEESKDPTARQNFEESQKKSAALLKGMQILARKTLSDEKVELKIRLDSDPDPNNPQATPGLLIQPMSKIGDEWKLGGSTHEYSRKWDEEGQIQSE